MYVWIYVSDTVKYEGGGGVFLSHLLANNLAQLVDILEQHVVVRHGHPGERGCSPRGLPPTTLNESSMIRPFYLPQRLKPTSQ